MSGFFEKAFDSLGSLFSPLGTNASLKSMFERCMSARTKKEEVRLITECLHIVKIRIQEPSNSPSIIARCLAFVIFAEMLGYKADFAYIYAVKLAQFGSLSEKRMGYIASIFLLQESDPLSVMVVNTILRDLGSKNILVVTMALAACCYLIPPNQAPTVIPLLVEKLNHPNAYVRSKAIIAMHHFLRTCPEHTHHYIDPVLACLGDKDPGVVGFVLQFVLEARQMAPDILIKYAPSLVEIQRQILMGKLPNEYTYRGVSAPWMQIALLRLFQCVTEPLKDIANLVHDTLQVAKTNGKGLIAEAVIIECINTLINWKVDNALNIAMSHISVLLSSKNHDLRYMGLELLENTVRHYHLELSSEQQRIVLTCLEHCDATVKHKTLHLLCMAANEKNVNVVCSQVADYAHSGCGGNVFLKDELVGQAVMLTQKFPSTSNYWHIAMLIRLLPLANYSQAKDVQKKIKCALLSDDSESIREARQKVLKILRKYSGSKTASTAILEIFVWTLSHFGPTSSPHQSDVMQEIVDLGRKILRNQPSEKTLLPEIVELLLAIIDAFMYIILQYGTCLNMTDFINEIQAAAVGNLYLRVHCSEILNYLPYAQDVCRHFKSIDWNEGPERMDFTLSFLDEYVCESLRKGEQPYQPKVPKSFLLDSASSGSAPECLIFSKAGFSGTSPSTCVSPVSSEKESCFGSVSSEDFKLCPVRSLEKEVSDVQLVWTKGGRLEKRESVVEEEKLETVPSGEKLGAGEGNAISESAGDVCETANKSRDPLEALLDQDFSKLSFEILEKT